eukprot:3799438-Alexandrium_andersonii.AAC.1
MGGCGPGGPGVRGGVQDGQHRVAAVGAWLSRSLLILLGAGAVVAVGVRVGRGLLIDAVDAGQAEGDLVHVDEVRHE